MRLLTLLPITSIGIELEPTLPQLYTGLAGSLYRLQTIDNVREAITHLAKAVELCQVSTDEVNEFSKIIPTGMVVDGALRPCGPERWLETLLTRIIGER